METKNIMGREYTVTGYVATERLGLVPLVNIRMMSDEREKELASKSEGATA